MVLVDIHDHASPREIMIMRGTALRAAINPWMKGNRKSSPPPSLPKKKSANSSSCGTRIARVLSKWGRTLRESFAGPTSNERSARETRLLRSKRRVVRIDSGRGWHPLKPLDCLKLHPKSVAGKIELNNERKRKHPCHTWPQSDPCQVRSTSCKRLKTGTSRWQI